MKNMPNGEGHAGWIREIVGPVSAENISQPQTLQGKREALTAARLDIYRLGHRLIQRLLDESKPLPDSAEALAFEEGFGDMTAEQLEIVDSMLEQIQELHKLTQGDREKTELLTSINNTEIGTAYFRGLINKDPAGRVHVATNPLGFIELTMMKPQNLNDYFDDYDNQKAQAIYDDDVEKYRMWGVEYPVIRTTDKVPYCPGIYSPARRNRITGNYIPMILISAHSGMEEISIHEIGHHLNGILSTAVEDVQYINGTDTPEQHFEKPTPSEIIDTIHESGGHKELTEIDLCRVSIDSFTNYCLSQAWNEITTDLNARGYPQNLPVVMQPGMYDYFVEVFGNDIETYNPTMQQLLIEARESYYRQIITIGQIILEVYEQLKEDGDKEKIDALFGMMRAKPIQLWAREIRRHFSTPKD